MRNGLRDHRQKTELLRSFDGFAGMHGRALLRLAAQFDDVYVPAGAVLAREGRPCHELMLVAAGEAVVRRRGAPVGTVAPGDVIGETAVLVGASHVVSVTSRTPMRLLVAGADSCRRLRNDVVVVRAVAMRLARQVRPDDRPLASHVFVDSPVGGGSRITA
jgi:CRP-like cAMP-binding protein